MRKIIKNKKGVSEVVGTVLLLGMAIALFSIVYIMSMNFIPFTPNAPSVRISGVLADNETEGINDTIYILHNGGDSLPDDTRIIFTDETGNLIYSSTVEKCIYPKTNNNIPGWDIGEIIYYTDSDFIGKNTYVIIVDVESNSIIEQDIFSGVN